jgi:hypothetical protein
MTAPKMETRGIRCLDCTGLDLKGDPAAARRGFGRCLRADPVIFVSAEMARNCLPFEPAPPETVAKRDAWAAKLAPWFDRQ